MKEQKLLTFATQVQVGDHIEKEAELKGLLEEGFIIKQFTTTMHPDAKIGASNKLFVTVLLERTKGE